MEQKYSEEKTRWQALVSRDSQADGKFVYGVITTGIYCRPVCASRVPKQKNVRFFEDWQEAEKAGFRPCKRCRPNENTTPDAAADAVAKACRIIEENIEEPSLKHLADAVGLSPYHFHRQFKKIMKVTPKQYMIEKRLGRVRSNLKKDQSITEAIYNAGYNSGSRFYEKARSALGMKPSEYQNGGSGILIHYGIFESYLGWVLVALSPQGVCRIDFDDKPDNLLARLEADFPKARLIDHDPDFKEVLTEVLAFLETPRRGISLPLDIQGTAFQKQVWDILQSIQPGNKMSYGEIAKKMSKPNAARAVANACAANKIAVAVPCHRAIRSNGELGGYRWGLERKKILLEREAGKTT